MKKILIFIILIVICSITMCSSQNINFKQFYNMVNINELMPGDMLITNATPFLGIAGHSAIVLNKNEVIHIPNPQSKVTVLPTRNFINLHRNGNIKVYRLNDSSKAKDSVDWVIENYKDFNAKYKLTMDLSTIDETYCSKLVWQAYYYGVGKEIVSVPMQDMLYGLRLPYSLADMFSRGEYHMEYIGLL